MELGAFILNSKEILQKLIAFPTVSCESNLDIVDFVRGLLESKGGRCHLVHNETRSKANLFAEFGPTNKRGFLVSGHSDVVPAKDQKWTSDPFKLTAREGRLFGRGTADMKGFLACVLNAVRKASTAKFKTPLWIAISYDEEIGCIGVRRLIDFMESHKRLSPLGCIVGEPTSMEVTIGHKGKTSCQSICRGSAAHTAHAPRSVNALYLACDFVGLLRDTQRGLAADGSHDQDYEIPYTTVHTSRINGGVTANIVPDKAVVDFEIRNIAADDPAKMIHMLKSAANRLVAEWRLQAHEAAISIKTTNSYPGLATPSTANIVGFVKQLAESRSTNKVAFGTEAGLFAERLGAPCVICGPGSMEQGHKPDEYVSQDQLERCDLMLQRLMTSLAAGIPPLN